MLDRKTSISIVDKGHMDQLPELVKVAISSACSSGKLLSWKFQESSGRTLVQLVWRAEPKCNNSVGGETTRVSSNRNQPSSKSAGKPGPKRKRISPSRARRNARRLEAFLERKKHSLMPVDDRTSQKVQADRVHVPAAMQSAVKPMCNDKTNDDLRLHIDKEVACVDFTLDKGEPGLNLELHSGESVWTPVCVRKPNGCDGNLSHADLSDMDEIVFQSHITDDTPGVVLRQGTLEVWTPVATRTRSRLRNSNKPPDLEVVV